MNIEDFDSAYEIKDLVNFNQIVFEKQHHSAGKYLEVEKRNGLLQTEDFPVNLNDRFGQARLKDFAWRTMEEVSEALEQLKYKTNVTEAEKHAHLIEELSDALHFMVELLLLAGIKYDEVPSILDIEASYDRAATDLYNFIIELGRAMNLLKNKPWKQTQVLTDEVRFKEYIIKAYESFIVMCLGFMKPVTLMNLYCKKNQVNEFRIRSNY